MTYHPSEKFFDNLRTMTQQFSLVIIVDNTPYGEKTYPIKNYASSKINIIANCKNVGIAKALNQGIEHARSYGAEWAITFDQDTIISSNFVEELLKACSHHLRGNNVGVIGVNYHNANNLQTERDVNDSEPILEVSDVITSGCLTSVQAFKEIGGFCEKLFIDMVDCEYCFRLRKNGYKVLIYSKPMMKHAVGNLEVITLLGKKIKLFNHTPFRRYFIFRNTIYMLKKYFFFDIKWCLTKIVFNYLPKLFIKACLLEKRKKENFKWIIKGIRDGIFSRYDNSFMENGK